MSAPLTRFERLLKRLALQPAALGEQSAEHSIFVGGAGEGGVGAQARLFGGLVAAQATMAAQLSETEFPLHSLHAYFLQPGRPEQDIEYHCLASKQGRNFAVRRVEAWQNGALIFQLQASFHRPEAGVHHQQPMPGAPPPESLPNRDDLRGRSYWRDMPIDVRMASPITGDQPQTATQQIWLRANGEMPDNAQMHLAMLVYASDRSLLDTAWRPHADRGQLIGASLDHSMWFHQPVTFDDWLLYALESPVASAGRGLAFGAIYNTAGQRVATVAQEGLLRFRSNS
ncbi:MAG: acyl-CoA thioesterase domain-containing protein [Pseudomonadota bacterium]